METPKRKGRFLSRLLLFSTAIPAIIATILFLPHWNHLAFFILNLVGTFLAAKETSCFFSNRILHYEQTIIPVAACLLPLTTYLESLNFLPENSFLPVLLFLCFCIFFRQLFVKKDFSEILTRTTASLMVLLYPALFTAFLPKISVFPHSSILYLVLLSYVLLNDTGAYLAGRFFGKGNKGFIPLSPNKSIAGFIGGFMVNVGVTLICYFLFPSIFHKNILLLSILCVSLCFTTFVGDLIESAFKRSANIKDSGNLLPGRGGLLDSVDSLVFSVPLFYYLVRLF